MLERAVDHLQPSRQHNRLGRELACAFAVAAARLLGKEG
jgi:hypothetical protein